MAGTSVAEAYGGYAASMGAAGVAGLDGRGASSSGIGVGGSASSGVGVGPVASQASVRPVSGRLAEAAPGPPEVPVLAITQAVVSVQVLAVSAASGEVLVVSVEVPQAAWELPVAALVA